MLTFNDLSNISKMISQHNCAMIYISDLKRHCSRYSFNHHEAHRDHLPVIRIAYCKDHLMLQSSQEYARVDQTGTRGSGGQSEIRGQREEISHK